MHTGGRRDKKWVKPFVDGALNLLVQFGHVHLPTRINFHSNHIFQTNSYTENM